MMKKIGILVIFIFSISTFVYCNGIELTLTQYDFDIFYVASFDPDHPETHPLIFVLTISNNDAAASHSCKLALEVSSVQYGEMLSKDDGTITKYNVWPFGNSESESDFLLLDPDDPPVVINNRDLINSEIEIEGDFNDILEGIEELEDQILSSGRLPDGIYTFTLYAFNPDDESEIYDEKEVTINVSNPNSIDLISPGEPFSNNPPEIVGNLPIFSWFSEASTFNLEIFEVEAGEYADEIIYKDPYFTEENISGNIHSYSDSSPILEENKTYAWRVIGVVITTQGESNLESELWCFKIAGSEGIEEPEIVNISNFIENLSNVDIINPDLLNISGFSPTGEIIINGEPISSDELFQLINSFLNGDYEVSRVEIE